MKPEELNYMGSDPGAVKYGNFINYYSFHNTKERTNNLHQHMFPILEADRPILCLDIGCNTGELTKELYAYLKSSVYPNHDIFMLGIDIDPKLIERAKESNVLSNVTFLSADVMKEESHKDIEMYLNRLNRKTFDISYSFSVTMWIHINNGDEGLERFLKFLTSISCTIILEPQPWNCYRNAQRRVKKSGSTFPFYPTLKIRSNIEKAIENFIISGNMHRKVYESSSSTWNRKIQCFHINK